MAIKNSYNISIQWELQKCGIHHTSYLLGSVMMTLLVPVLYAFFCQTPLIPQDREKYFVMDFEYLVLTEVL